MISNSILQETIDGIKKIAGIDLCVLEEDGKMAAFTREGIPVTKAGISEFLELGRENWTSGGLSYFRITADYQLAYILVLEAVGGHADVVGRMASFQIRSLLAAYKEHFDKDNFIKNLLLDNLLLVDIYSRAKKLHIATDVRRVVYILEAQGAQDFALLDEVRNLYASSKTDFITAVDEKSTIIVRELVPGEGPEELARTARSILTSVSVRPAEELRIAYGNVVSEIKEVSRSYKEARMALDVGKIFFEDSDVIAYSQLGIGRLIYQLPIPLCKMFIREIFSNRSMEEFDEATIATIDKFFENNLNVSETSRQLYIHRNTLVYRLDKLQKSTGLDLRIFEDAITFKIALMVVRYMKYMEAAEY